MNLIARLMEPNGREGPHLSPTGPSLPGQGHSQENKIEIYAQDLRTESRERGRLDRGSVGQDAHVRRVTTPHPNYISVNYINFRTGH